MNYCTDFDDIVIQSPHERREDSRAAPLLSITDWPLLQYRCRCLEKLEQVPIQPTRCSKGFFSDCSRQLLTADTVSAVKIGRSNGPLGVIFSSCRLPYPALSPFFIPIPSFFLVMWLKYNVQFCLASDAPSELVGPISLL